MPDFLTKFYAFRHRDERKSDFADCNTPRNLQASFDPLKRGLLWERLFQDNKSRLCLGTVQLGTKYGVNNAIGRQPTRDEAVAVINAALDAGIRCFDTASVYGSAEEILGDVELAGRLKAEKAEIFTKLRPEVADDGDAVITEIKASLERLKAEKAAGVLLHRASDLYRPQIMAGLAEAERLGLADCVGVSIYEPVDALAAVRDERIGCIQIPYNVLDRRLDKTEFFSTARARGVKVFARSAFLQGLLLMKPEEIPDKLAMARPYVEKFQAIAGNYGFSPLEAAFLYSYCHDGIDFVLFGVDTAEQLAENVRLCDKVADFRECYAALAGEFQDVPHRVIVPSEW